MSSSVFFKFKSQKEPTRVEFDGTGISVFELKRDIILKSGLGDGTDFDLAIYSEDGSDEYDDDTTIIPRSTTVVARRLPASKPGAGRGARYVSGKMPQSAKNSARREQAIKATTSKPANSTVFNQMNSALTEEEKMNAMFAAQSEQWSAQQEEMSHQTPVFNKGGAKRPANVPDHDPPNGYICYRCGEKGHWIQLCPTNDDPEFDNRPRVKRTTGIPRSFLKTVDKSAVLAQAGDDDAKRPSGIMVNADGEYVVAEPDKASWEQFQARAKSSATAAKAINLGDKEVEEKGLACPIDKKMFVEPMMTPCCKKTYCNDCITNALIESDFVCPNCKTDGVLIDDLKVDDGATEQIEQYLKEKAEAKSKAEAPVEESTSKTEAEPAAAEKDEKAASPAAQGSPTGSPAKPADDKDEQTDKTDNKSPTSATATPTTVAADSAAPADANPKKRPADELMENPKIPKAPKAMQRQMEQQQQQQQQAMMNGMFGMPMNPMMGFNGMPMNNFPMGMPNMGMPMGMPNMGMGMPMMNGMNPMMGFNGMNGNGGFNGGFNNGNNMNGGMNGGMGMGMNNFNNQQQRHNFTQPNNDDGAYFRQPVNPQRHQQRQRRVRPSDYREL
ncbi:MPE1 protein [Plectosphaerella cucumerina]|uniref:MPE1 protein n=1 Tax=Plectosphaerella cucumerina TaxID=40658 RepID=A0A8K0TE53_9PEZI|nr:MPE1 protein [Plectosphaerella cucumerina]